MLVSRSTASLMKGSVNGLEHGYVVRAPGDPTSEKRCI